jgi:hypothetical protein
VARCRVLVTRVWAETFLGHFRKNFTAVVKICRKNTLETSVVFNLKLNLRGFLQKSTDKHLDNRVNLFNLLTVLPNDPNNGSLRKGTYSRIGLVKTLGELTVVLDYRKA